MSDTPEKKVLKETLTRLKTKSITSISSYKLAIKPFFDTYRDMMKSLTQMTSELREEDKQKASTLIFLLSYLLQDFERLVTSSLATIDDMKLYADTLESYSVELDNTLTAIFEQAKKYAEEKTKEQQELMKKDDTASYVK